MFEEKRLSNDGTDTARSEQPGWGSDEVDEENDQIAHRRIVSGRRILRNYWRNNNSPATGPDSHLLDCIQRVFGSAAMRKIPAHDRSCEAVDYADQVPFRNCKVEERRLQSPGSHRRCTR